MSAQVQGYIDKVEKLLHEKNKFTEYLTIAEQKTGVKRLYLVAGLFVIYLYHKNLMAFIN